MTAHLAALAMLAVAPIIFLLLLFIPAPYGRHTRARWGPSISARSGWLIMESPAVLWFALVFSQGTNRGALAPIALALLFQLHYVHRTALYPFRIMADRPMPVVIVALGFGFNLWNGFMNARHLSHEGTYDAAWLSDPRFIAGALLFIAGFLVNRWADGRLIALKREHDGYRIPRGGLFEYVCCPNYFGEVLEWTGWAIATWSLPGLAFAVFTFANLAPRALTHRRWYRETFEDFPKERRAIIPFLL